ncbi:MAG: SpoIIE family protein phosphatase [Treponema sp.]|nr:SpoIIE family protein phosphatase [Treponema sp.]
MAILEDVATAEFLSSISDAGLPHNRYGFRQFGSIVKYCEPVNGRVSILELYDMFRKDPTLEAIPIEEDDSVIGVLDRFEINEHTNTVLKRFFAKSCNYYVRKCPITIYAREYIQNREDTIEDINNSNAIFYFPVFDRSKAFFGIFSIKDMRKRMREISDNDMEKATAQQRALMPDTRFLEKLPFNAVIWNKMANKVGGDMCILTDFKGTKYIAACFDVSGKNVSAAMVTMTIGAFFPLMKMLHPTGVSASEFICILDSFLASVVRMDSFVTATLCFIDYDTMTIDVYNCGHTAMHVCEQTEDGTVLLTKYQPSFSPLGLGGVKHAIESGDRNILTLTIKKGLHISLHTDGFTDMLSENGERFEEDRVKQFFNDLYTCKKEDITKHIETTINDWVGITPLADDISIMNLRF